jgi:hypothetical protein
MPSSWRKAEADAASFSDGAVCEWQARQLKENGFEVVDAGIKVF